MSGYILTPRARADIFQIWSYIAADSEHAADRVEQAIYDACDLIAADPEGGHRRKDITELPVRLWTLTRYPNFIVIYRPETSPVHIIAVVHGKRELRRIMSELP